MKLLVISLFILFVSSCQKDQSPIPTNTGRDVSGNDDLSPTPTPVPAPVPTTPPLEEEVVSLQPSDLNKNDTNVVYRKMFRPIGLNEPRDDHRFCHPDYKDRCVVNRQVLFQFSTTFINENYPSELWDILKINLTANFYSVGKNQRTELLCLLNNRVCSGKAISQVIGLKVPFLKILWRNHKFWIGRDEDHVLNDKFHHELIAGAVDETIYIRENLSMDLKEFLSLATTDMQTLVRKNEGIKFSVTDDTYVEDPILTIRLRRRHPSRTE
ncbi:MAG: hypothetical protein K9K67_13120 [Bacteriovoracaceae bacterium]|nr:hypothetical protein [Bacteriovoracaceae bacterium]